MFKVWPEGEDHTFGVPAKPYIVRVSGVGSRRYLVRIDRLTKPF